LQSNERKVELNRTSDKTKSNSNSITGKVVRISDGDTFELLFENGFKTKVRLNGIDCPEKKQPFSKRAKQALSDFIYDKEVLVEYDSKDGYGRVIGTVYANSLNVNREMVRKGLAWHFKKYSDDQVLSSLEQEARKNKIGLWQEPNPVAPWDYRKSKK
jgi:endonuclease YncB( thermonuclease family)